MHTLPGFSAHADQKDLLGFVGRMRKPPRQVRLVHGDEDAKATLAALLRQRHPGVEVVVPVGVGGAWARSAPNRTPRPFR